MEIQKLFVSLALEAAEYAGGLDDAQKQANSFAGNVVKSIGDGLKAAGQVATTAMLAVGTTITGVAVAGSLAFVDFQKGMNEVFTLMPGVSQAAMDEMGDQVMALSREFGTLPDEVIPALYQALSAGVPPDNVFEFLETANKAAIGGITDLETAVDGITSVVNAYGAEVLDAATASDVMFTAVRLGKTDFGQLSSSLFNVIPTAASLGITFEDVAAQLAVMTAQGVPTSVATTQLRQAFIEASKGGTLLSDAIKDLTGQSFTELIAEGMTSTEIFQQLRESMPEQEFKDLFGSVEALNAVLATTGPNFETTQAAMDEMRNSTGATDAAFGTMSQSMQFNIDRLQAFGATVLVEIGKSLEPLLVVLLTLAEGALPAFERAVGLIMPVVEAVAGAVGSFLERLQGGQPLLAAVQFLIYDLATAFGLSAGEAYALVQRVMEFVTSAQAMWAQITALLAPVLEAVAGFVSWQDVLVVVGALIVGTILAALYSLLAPFALVIAAVGAAILVVAALRTVWEEHGAAIQTAVIGAYNVIAPIVQTALTTIQGIIQTVLGAVTAWWNENWITIQAVVLTAWTVIQAVIAAAIAIIGPAIRTFVANVQAGFANMSPLLETFKQLWVVLQPVITTVLSVLGAAILFFVSVVVGMVNGVSQAIQPLLTTFTFVMNGIITALTGVVQFVTGFVQLITALFQGNSEAVQAAWQQMGEGVTRIIAGLIEAIVGGIAGLVTTVITFISGLVTGVIEFFNNLYQTLVGGSIIPDMVNAIIAWVTTLVTTFIAIVTDLWAQVSALFQTGADFIINLVATAFAAIQATIQTVITAVQAFLAATWTAIQATWNAALTAVRTLTTAGFTAIRTLITAAMTAVRALIIAAWNAIRSAWTAALNTVRSITTGAFNTIRNAITGGMNAIRSTVAAAWTAIYRNFISGRDVIVSVVSSLVQSIKAAFNIDWGAIGRAVIDGIKNGIQNAISGLASAAANAAKAALDAAKAALGISSPSKEGIDIGVNFFSSIGAGAVRTVGRLAREIGGAIEQAVVMPATQAAPRQPVLATATAAAVRGGGAAVERPPFVFNNYGTIETRAANGNDLLTELESKR